MRPFMVVSNGRLEIVALPDLGPLVERVGFLAEKLFCLVDQNCASHPILCLWYAPTQAAYEEAQEKYGVPMGDSEERHSPFGLLHFWQNLEQVLGTMIVAVYATPTPTRRVPCKEPQIERQTNLFLA